MSNYISDAFLRALLYKSKNKLHSMECLNIDRKERLELTEKIAVIRGNLKAIKSNNRSKDD